MSKEYIQIYILSLYMNINEQSKCLTKINETLNINKEHTKHIYFKRKSIKATVRFEQLEIDSRSTDEFIPSYQEKINRANSTITRLLNYFANRPTLIVDSEDLVRSNLIDCEQILQNFSSLLRINVPITIILHDSYHFLEDATWWDLSEVAERSLDQTIPSTPLNLTYSNDFYHLYGGQSFVEYLSDTRQCVNEGILSQMQSKTIRSRTSRDVPDRCPSKPFDCAFSDIYSFQDREELYQKSNREPLKCGFAVPTIFDEIRARYSRNHTCETIIYTVITNCYDPLPIVRGAILPSFCFIAIMDTETIKGHPTFYKKNPDIPRIHWDIIDLGNLATPFSVPAKTTETLKTLGLRLFPLAKWIIWLDGKAHFNDISGLLMQARAPVIGAAHGDSGRTSALEVSLTMNRLRIREKSHPQRLNNSISDIILQEKEYIRDGFYSRSDALKLKMYNIAVFLYRNNHPCIFRYLCGWHNEVNYFSYRGQLSVYYSAVRLNLTNYLHFLPRKFSYTSGHRAVC